MEKTYQPVQDFRRRHLVRVQDQDQFPVAAAHTEIEIAALGIGAGKPASGRER